MKKIVSHTEYLPMGYELVLYNLMHKRKPKPKLKAHAQNADEKCAGWYGFCVGRNAAMDNRPFKRHAKGCGQPVDRQAANILPTVFYTALFSHSTFLHVAQ